MFAQRKVQGRLKELKRQMSQDIELSAQKLLEMTTKIYEMGTGQIESPLVTVTDGVPESHMVKQKDLAAANQALEKLYKYSGMYEADNVQKSAGYLDHVSRLPAEVQDRILEGIYAVLDEKCTDDDADCTNTTQLLEADSEDDWLGD